MNYKKEVWIFGLIIVLLLVTLTSASNLSFDIPIEIENNSEQIVEEEINYDIPIEIIDSIQ